MNDWNRYVQAQTTRPWLYIAGPMMGKAGDSQWLNCQRGMLVAAVAWHAGWHPICPHLNGAWEMVLGKCLDEKATDGAGGWLDFDFSYLTRCDALYRIPGPSSGADREVVLMDAVGKLVLHGPAEPTVEEFPRPQDYLVYHSGLWLPKPGRALVGQ